MDNELKHYGVIGMRWGIRKAKRRGVKYTYKSRDQKKYEKKLKKAVEAKKSKKEIKGIQDKIAEYKQRDKGRQKYAESTTAGKAIARGLLLGPFGSGTYNRLRAAGYDKQKALSYTASLHRSMSLPASIILSRSQEKKQDSIELDGALRRQMARDIAYMRRDDRD